MKQPEQQPQEIALHAGAKGGQTFKKAVCEISGGQDPQCQLPFAAARQTARLCHGIQGGNQQNNRPQKAKLDPGSNGEAINIVIADAEEPVLSQVLSSEEVLRPASRIPLMKKR